MQYGLLGRTLGHSYSPQIHAKLGTYSYSLFEKEPDALEDFLLSGSFSGLNVTIPYKKAVIPYCANLSDCARALGAVNTIVRNSDGSLIGHNTDYYGFASMLKKSRINMDGKKALVLGSGGASATAAKVLRDQHAEVVVVSRSGENNYNNLDLHTDAALIVNATPVGMYPAVEDTPLKLSRFKQLEGVLDLIYNPARTRLLQEAEQLGLIHENGLWMLVAQAKESAEWFTGAAIDDSVISEIYQALKLEMENVILIGMPGAGKTTIGRSLAGLLGKEFIDADDAIVKKTGISIPEIFANNGEEAFRKIETEILAEICKRSGCVISTGGGCVTRSDNYPLLHQNGRIIWLKRDPELLPIDGRPLSKAGSVMDMYRVRKALYAQFSDLTIDNNRAPECTLQNILKLLHEGELYENTRD